MRIKILNTKDHELSKIINIGEEGYERSLSDLENHLITLVMLFDKAMQVDEWMAYLLDPHPHSEEPPAAFDLHDEVCPFCSIDHDDWDSCADIYFSQVSMPLPWEGKC